jgi:hypothetical protein
VLWPEFARFAWYLGQGEFAKGLPGVTVRVAVALLPPPVAVIVTVTVTGVKLVVIVKVVEFDPAGTTTDAGTWATVELLESFTGKPPVGALPERVIVPVAVFPETTVVGEIVRPVTQGASTSIVQTPVPDVNLAVVFDATGVVVIVNVADFKPAATTTGFDAFTALELLVTVTDNPPVGAAPFKVKVPMEELPPIRVFGLQLRVITEGGVTTSAT